MDERYDDVNIREFEYMLREQRAFLEKLLKQGVSDEAEEEIKVRLEVIAATLGE